MTSPAIQLEQLHIEARACTRCFDEGYNVVPGAVVRGRADAKIMSIGQAPGPTEVEAKRPFNAGSGRRLFQWLGAAGFDEDTYRATQFMTSVTKCYPGKHPGGKGDRVPTKIEQGFCRHYLLSEIAIVQPRVMIPIGGLAIKLFYPAKMKLVDLIGSANYFAPGDWDSSDPFSLKGSVRVTEMVTVEDGTYIVPLPHPSGASLWPNKPENKLLIERAIRLLSDIRVTLAL